MRLIDADKFAEDICKLPAIDEHSANAVIFLLHEQPTVDIKTEVAREIFAEIEKLTASVYNDFMFNTEGVGMRALNVVVFSDRLDDAIAELKNKYTEANK